MKKIRNFVTSLTTAVLLTGLAINFNACSEQSPLASVEDDAQDSVSLFKGNPNSYPQSGSVTLSVTGSENYQGGNINLSGGSGLSVANGALTAPVGTPNGADVTLTMLVERSEDGNNDLFFTFGPHGSQFNPPVEITFDWADLGSEIANLYYIDENGNFIQQEPDQIDVHGRKMTLFLDHFSRYAIGAE